MEQILNEYCKQFNPGLLLLSRPTGSGKTYTVLKFIYSNYEEFAAQNRKILFITNLKKNLPIDELKERFIADGKEDEFDKYVLFIDSNIDSVTKNILPLDDEIPDQFKTEIYKKLKSHIETLQNRQLPKEFKDSWETEIRRIIEPKFRKTIIEALKNNFKTKNSRLLAIKNDQDYQWIGKLYPAVFTDEKTIFFLSIDKFVAKNTTLVENSYYFNERFIDQALIFIDEFDTTKEAVLNNIIKSGLQHRVDLLDLFLNIHNHLMPNECPELLSKESEWFQKKSGGKNWLAPRQQIETFRKKANDIFTTYKLQHTCKSHEEFSTNKRNFLFYDYQFHNVLDRHQRIEIIEDSQTLTNWIKAFDTKTKKTGVDIHELLSNITGFLTYFQTGIKYLANNYRHLKDENKSINEAFSLEFAVKSVLNHFRLDDTDVEFLTSKILEDDFSYGLQTDKGTIQRQGFYDTGFRYHDIVDSDEHDTLSKIYMLNFSRTPESFLAGVCSKAMVVGISATAGLYTNIGNYDLEYLKSRLGNSFIRLKEDAIIRLKNAYSEATKGYDQVVIKTEFIGTDSQKEAIKQLEELLRDREAAHALWNDLRHKNTDDDEKSLEFSFCRYVRALTAWKYFLDHSDCHAFLCLFSKLPQPSDPKFDLNILYEYAKLLLDDNQDVIDGSVDDTIFLLRGENFDENKKKLLNELKDNKRRFIISTYQTIGVGQNLQFPIPSNLEPIHINSFPKHSDMDINGIYLDSPRNLLVSIFESNLKDDDFIKYIFQLEFLRENGAFSLNTFKSKLDEAFHRYIGRYKPKRKADDFISLYNTGAYSLFLNKIIIQAIGRICRTNMKAPTIHILADASIRKHLTRFSIPEDVIPVREYTALLELAGESTKQSEDLIEAQNRASNKSNQSYAYIRRQLNTPWTPKTIKEWQNLREQVLRQPAITKESECNPNWNSIIYLKLPKAVSSYRYLEEYDYSEIEVFFSEEYGKKEVKEVSEGTARLSNLMRIDILHKLFIDSGWTTAFPESELMLTPPMFNNIYKGALGEVCGKHIFQSLLNIDLLELDVDEFERFDFKTEQNIYIDFKLWNDQVAVPADELIDKIREKMAIVKAEKVFVINILGTSNTAFRPIISDNLPLTSTLLKSPKQLHSKLDGQGIHIVDRVNDEESVYLVMTLKQLLLPYITDENLITVGKRDKKDALNFRIIHDADFYEKMGQEDEYLPSTDEFRRQHLTIESSINVSDAIVKTIIKEQLIKRDISSRTLNLFDWAKLELKGVWTFAAWDEDRNHVIFMEIQPNGNFEFYEIEDRGIFNWEKFDKYKDAMIDSSSGDKSRTLEGLVISDTGDINQIFRSDEITIPELSKIEAIINEVETEFPENKRSGNALAVLIQEFMTESSRKDNEELVRFSDELQILGSNELDKKSFKKLLNERLGKSSNISSELRNYLLNKHNIRLIFSKQKENLEDLFDASLNIKYFGETEKEAYYFVGDRNVKDYSFKDACHLRQIVAVNDWKLIFRQLLQTMDVDFVRTGQSTVIPFPFKYIREYKNFGVAK